MTAVAVTCGMIWRGVATLGAASFGVTAVMVFVAAVSGLLLPTLTFLGRRFDGSRVSRERDSLVAQLDDDLERYQATISNGRRDLADAAAIGDTLKGRTFPDICNTTQEAVDEVYEFYAKSPPAHRRPVGRPARQDRQDHQHAWAQYHRRVHRRPASPAPAASTWARFSTGRGACSSWSARGLTSWPVSTLCRRTHGVSPAPPDTRDLARSHGLPLELVR